MAGRYLDTYFTPKVLAAQRHYFGRSQNLPPQPAVDPLTDEERVFIEARDSFYMATITENGWPYVQSSGCLVGAGRSTSFPCRRGAIPTFFPRQGKRRMPVKSTA